MKRNIHFISAIMLILSIFFSSSEINLYAAETNSDTNHNLTFRRERSNIEHCSLNAITYNKGLFVAVGDDGRISTSSDGETWRDQYTEYAFDLKDVVSNGNNFITIGYRGAYSYWYGREYLIKGGILISSDGNTWINVGPNNFVPQAIVWDGNRYLTAGIQIKGDSSSVVIYESKNGKEWKQIVGDLSFREITGLIYAKNQYVMISGWERRVVSTSKDAVTWEDKYNERYIRPFSSILWDGTQYVFGAFSAVVKSKDFIQWDKVPLETYHQRISNISFNGKQYIGIGLNSKISVSEDTIKWTQISVSQESYNTIYDAAWGNGQWIVVGEHGIIANSTDGIQWNVIRDPDQTNLGHYNGSLETKNHVHSLVDNSNFYIATGISNRSIGLTSDHYEHTDLDGIIALSDDGINWDVKFFDGETPYNLLIFKADSYYIAVNQKTGALVKSKDGISWEEHDRKLDEGGLNDFVWTQNDLLINLGHRFYHLKENKWIEYDLLKSSLKEALGDSTRLEKVVWNGEIYLGVLSGAENRIISSRDGIQWYTLSGVSFDGNKTGSIPIHAEDLLYAKGRFILIGSGISVVYSSKDGLTWEKVLEDKTTRLQNAYYINNLFWVTDEHGTIFTSVDGRNWIKHKPVTNNGVNSILWDGDKYLLFCEDGVIISAK
ncbi:hypothetical protein [Defluviitalea saccharophila]|uniref:Photosynthesis system II assembly factor Ycf48/Hcf136-like domain-containing protein n=1 Tax=Defluviitalea saccharophila TaxID=879970 RepID=A0ABZ2Y5G9_9FIRM